MNQSSAETSSSSVGPDTISRRAYELWEQEGRPEGRDLEHWLQAEQELRSRESNGSSSSETNVGSPAEAAERNTDTRPLQGTRAAAAANREPRRSSGTSTPFERSGNGGSSGSGRRKAGSTPAL